MAEDQEAGATQALVLEEWHNHIMKSETIMLTVALALAITLVGGLIVVPAMTDEAEVKNGKSKKPKLTEPRPI
jgi:hypothetical protein